MTDFNNQMRTDEFTQRDRHFYHGQEQRAQFRLMDTVEQLPQQVMGMHRARADLRLQRAVADQQFQRNKMSQMLMMDQVDMSAQQVRSAKLANDRMEQDMVDRRRAQDNDAKSNRMQFMARILPQMQRIGKTLDDSGRMRDMTPEERKQFAESGGRRGPTDLDYQNAARLRLDSFVKANTVSSVFHPDNLSKDDRALFERLKREAFGSAPQSQLGYDPGAALEDQHMPTGQMQPNPAQQGYEVPEDVRYQMSVAYNLAQENPAMGELLAGAPDKGSRFLFGVGRAATILSQQDGLVTEDQAAALVMDQIMQGGDEAAYYMMLGGFKEDWIRNFLRTRPAYLQMEAERRDQIVDDIINRQKKHAETLRKKYGG